MCCRAPGSKAAIIDRRLVVGGSFNYTAADTKNAENVTFTVRAEVASLLLANWERGRQVSRRFVSP